MSKVANIPQSQNHIKEGPESENSIITTKSVVKETLEYTPDVATRRQAWLKLAQELGIDESKVNITNTGIEIQGVAKFQLMDDESASYDELKVGKKGGFERIPQQDIWTEFAIFVDKMTRGQRDMFVYEVMKMGKTQWGDGNFYLSISLDDSGDHVYALSIGSDRVYSKGRVYKKSTQGCVRRLQNF